MPSAIDHAGLNGHAIDDLAQLVDEAAGTDAKRSLPCYANVIDDRKHGGEQA